MKKWIVAFGACAALSTFPMGVFAHGYDAGNAALGGLVGGVVGGLIGAGGFPVYVAPAPVVVAPAPIVVAPYYAPAPIVVEPYGASPGYYRWHQRYYPYHPRHHHHDHD